MARTAEEIPFMTKYDPPGSSEGTLDPLGLYLLADQLATKLVPAVRERMLRIRFLTALTVGSLVTEGVECNPRYPETPPYLVWEWLVVEAIVRCLMSFRSHSYSNWALHKKGHKKMIGSEKLSNLQS